MTIEERFDLPPVNWPTWMGIDGNVYGTNNIGQWTCADRAYWFEYVLIGHYQCMGMHAGFSFNAPDDDAAREVVKRLMRKFPASATEDERETIRWCRDHGCRVERTLIVYEKAHPEPRKKEKYGRTATDD